MRKSRRIRNRIIRAVLIPGMVVIDYLTYTEMGTPTPRNLIPFFLAFISHFAVAGYYYQVGEKKDDRPYKIYAYVGFICPSLAVLLVEEIKGKAREITDNIIFWTGVVVGFTLFIGVIVSFFLPWDI